MDERSHRTQQASLPWALAEWAEEHRIELEFSKPGKPTQNSYVERFNRTYRDEILNMYVFRTLNEVREITENWIREYNEERPHDALNDLTPWEFYTRPDAEFARTAARRSVATVRGHVLG